MKVSSAFPSTYLKAADLEGRNIGVTMDYVKMEDIGGDHKPVLYFVGKEKGMVLNKTNANNITMVYGDESDDWRGGELTLYSAMVDFQGRSVEAIRVRARPRPARPAPQAAMNQEHPVSQDDRRGDPSDDIPF